MSLPMTNCTEWKRSSKQHSRSSREQNWQCSQQDLNTRRRQIIPESLVSKMWSQEEDKSSQKVLLLSIDFSFLYPFMLMTFFFHLTCDIVAVHSTPLKLLFFSVKKMNSHLCPFMFSFFYDSFTGWNMDLKHL